MKISKQTFLIVMVLAFIAIVALSVLAFMGKVNIIWVALCYVFIYLFIRYFKKSNGL